jgi:hypothetical protein
LAIAQRFNACRDRFDKSLTNGEQHCRAAIFAAGLHGGGQNSESVREQVAALQLVSQFPSGRNHRRSHS